MNIKKYFFKAWLCKLYIQFLFISLVKNKI